MVKLIRRKNRVYKVATKTLWQKGYNKTSVRDIAKATDMTTAGLYYYFKSKESIWISEADRSSQTKKEGIGGTPQTKSRSKRD